MTDQMDVVQSLQKIARELKQFGLDFENGNMTKEDLIDRVDGAAYLIDYIAKALDHELGLAQQRANALRYRQIGQGQ